jgi:hypothetical protein
MGYWEMEPDSLKASANSIIMIPSLYILNVGPSVVFAFYTVDEPTSPSPSRMDVWYTDVLINANVQHSGEASPQSLDMHLDGVFSAGVFGSSSQEILYNPIAEETSISVTDVWLNGEPLTTSPIDISDWADPRQTKTLQYACLGEGRISLQSPESGVPVFLHSTTPLTRVRP